jgi:hypothetical protein
MLKLALPVLSNGKERNTVDPSLRTIAPVGVNPSVTGPTTKLNVIVWPTLALGAEEVRVTLLEACFTVCFSDAELTPKFVSPPYVAVML